MSHHNRRRRRAWLSLVLLPILGLLIAACGSSASSSGGAGAGASTGATSHKTITITDQVGRKVTIAVPVTKVFVLSSYDAELVRGIGAGKAIVADTNDTDPSLATNAANKSYLASFGKAVDVGTYLGDLNWEAIVTSGAQVAIMWSNSPWQEAVQKLSPFGIKVIVVTAWEPAVMRKYIPILGEMFGTEAQAAKLAKLYDDIGNLLKTRLPGVATPTVYFENQSNYAAALPGSGWDSSVVEGGGSNIYGNIHLNPNSGNVQTYPVDPASVVKRDPDFILRVGVAGQPTGNSCCITPWPKSAFTDEAQSIASRPGWSDINAVKTKEIYVFNNFFFSALGKQIGALAVAKWLHPTQFANVNLQDYFNRWLQLQGIAPQPLSDYVYKY
jgi:iron complex transport system substrate-binding protein